jgi:hypothetical protein
MLRRLVLSLVVYMHPPMMCVSVSGDWYFVHTRDGLCFVLHLWMCAPHATYNESLLARKGVVEHVWSNPEVLALCRI